MNTIPAKAQMESSRATRQIRSMMLEKIQHKGKQPVHSFMLFLENRQTGFLFHEGHGLADGKSGAIEANAQYNTASITKTLVATVLLQLMEKGRLQLDEPAGNYLDGLDYLEFDRFHVFNDTTYAHQITIRQLLTHETGIPDIFTDAETRFNLSVFFHRKRQYNPEKIIRRYYKYKLNETPFFAPGEGYHYSDMNYVLLGLIIEQITGQSLPQAIRSRILEPLQLDNTYFEYYEPERGGVSRAHAFINRFDITKKINTSYEWAGGGIVSTTGEMAIFIKALFKGQLFQNASTLEKMIKPARNNESNYGLGIYHYDIAGEDYYGHGGFYGALLIHQPEKGITLSASINQANPEFDARQFVAKVIGISEKVNR